MTKLNSRERERVILLVEEDGVRHDEEREDEDEQEYGGPGRRHVQGAAEDGAPRLVALHVSGTVRRVDRQQYDRQLRQSQRRELVPPDRGRTWKKRTKAGQEKATRRDETRRWREIGQNTRVSKKHDT